METCTPISVFQALGIITAIAALSILAMAVIFRWHERRTLEERPLKRHPRYERRVRVPKRRDSTGPRLG